MGKNIQCTLNTKSLREAINELEKYADSLMKKNDLFVKRLAEIGIPVVDEQIASAHGDSDKTHYTYIKLQNFQSHSRATLIAEGQDLLFIEFGAGVHYNGAAGTSPHPKGEELGYTIGSYGKGQGKNQYWYYVDETGVKHRSYGTQATFPMYSAWMEMKSRMIEIAKEVFGNG